MKTANTQKVFKAFAEKTTKMAKSILRSKGKNASGNLEDSIGYNLKVYPRGALELQFKAAEYAKFVDKKEKLFSQSVCFDDKNISMYVSKDEEVANYLAITVK